MKYSICENCGAHLDAGEKCDCRTTNGSAGAKGLDPETEDGQKLHKEGKKSAAFLFEQEGGEVLEKPNI